MPVINNVNQDLNIQVKYVKMSLTNPWSFSPLIKFNEGSDQVRCLLINYSRAFDTIDHSILFQELRALNLLLKIYNWFAAFFTGRSQCVKLQSIRSALAVISRSVVQRSRIGPYLYILLVRKLKIIFIIKLINTT